MSGEIVIYECKGKGGNYQRLLSAKPAGTAKQHGDVIMYQCKNTGEVYYRFEQDFNERMTVIEGDFSD